jgi:hypothetical protein
MDAFSCAEVMGNLEVNRLQDGQIKNIEGLAGLTRVGGDFYLGGTGTADLDALSELRSVDGFFEVAGHPLLTDVTGLSALREVGDYFIFLSNSQLVEISGIDRLERVGGDIGAISNPSLERYVGFGALTELGENIGFFDNPILSDIDAFSSVERLPGFLLFFQNDALDSLDFLSSFREIAGHLQIQHNAVLRNLDGLQNLERIGGLALTENPLLDRCACGVGRLLSTGEVGEPLRVEENAPDSECASVEAIIAAFEAGDACATDTAIEEVGAASTPGLTVFPNPVADAATFRFAVAEQAEATLVIYDTLGREVARPVDGCVFGAIETPFDTSTLPVGVYLARLTAGDRVETVRLTVTR